MTATAYTWTDTTTIANLDKATYDIFLYGYAQPINRAGPPLSPAAFASLHLGRARHAASAPTHAALRSRCALLTLAPRRQVVVRGNVSWIRQGGKRPLRRRR